MIFLTTARPFPPADLSLLEDREIGVQMEMPPHRRVACIDFDGVIADYGEGFQGIGVYGELLLGTVGALRRLTIAGWHIIICTARRDAEIPFIEQYLDKHGVFYSQVTTKKPMAHVYVDDRGLRFDGDWKKTLREILEFEPYYHKIEV